MTRIPHPPLEPESLSFLMRSNPCGIFNVDVAIVSLRFVSLMDNTSKSCSLMRSEMLFDLQRPLNPPWMLLCPIVRLLHPSPARPWTVEFTLELQLLFRICEWPTRVKNECQCITMGNHETREIITYRYVHTSHYIKIRSSS